MGFTTPQAVICSATALAGAGQFIALAVLGKRCGGRRGADRDDDRQPALRAVRGHALPLPARRPAAQQAPIAFTLTDETFAVNIAEHRLGLSSPASMIGVGVIAWCGWVLGTWAGAFGADWIGDPARFGVGFAMPAMFTALFIALAEDWRHVVTGLFAGASSCSCRSLHRPGCRSPQLVPRDRVDGRRDGRIGGVA